MSAFFKTIVPLLFLLYGFALPKAVTQKQALRVANTVLQREKEFAGHGPFAVGEIRKIACSAPTDSLYLVSLKPRGFLLLNADDRLRPLIGYSRQNTFSGGATVRLLLEKIVRVQRRVALFDTRWVQKNRLNWRSLSKGGSPVLAKTSGDSVYYFPTPVWGQGMVNGVYVFNYYTPNHWSAGCVATALAEVLAFFRWPPVGTASHCYTENDAGQLCADYQNTHYDWPDILPKYINEHTTAQQRRAAGLLTYHAAISVNMDFSANGSTANVSNVPYALHHYFRFSGHYKSAGETDFWTELIHNMKDARPAILAISRSSDGFGHAIVADGYSEHNGLFHLNMGWNGSDNGWYDIRGDWNVSGYDIVNGATKGIVPSPMICPEVTMLSARQFILSWRVSRYQKACYYQVQQAQAAGGPWTTLAEAVTDTFLQISVPQISRYYYRVRARRDDIWWDWSAVQSVSLGGPRYLTFNVDMRYQTLTQGDSVVLRGNVPPLKGSVNSRALQDEDGDSVYSLTLPFDVAYVGHELLYRFAIAGAAGTHLESFNRSYVIGAQEYQNLDTVFFDDYTALARQDLLPEHSRLIGNFPNPFNPVTFIRYRIAKEKGRPSVHVRLTIYNVLGQTVARLIDKNQSAGEYRVRFRADGLPAGLYFCRLQTDDCSGVRKMILIK